MPVRSHAPNAIIFHRKLTRTLSPGIMTGGFAGLMAFSTVMWADQADILQRYEQADRMLSINRGKLVLNGDIQHHWIDSQDQFWYRREEKDGKSSFVIVDASDGSAKPAFDHRRLASTLSKASGETVNSGTLPFSSVSFDRSLNNVSFEAYDKGWVCDVRGRSCKAGESADLKGIVSPDGKWRAFERDYNLFIEPVGGGTARALTSDGVRNFAYAGYSEGDTRFIARQRAGTILPAAVIWSPDSKRILTHRLDERSVEPLHLVQSVPEDGSFRPKLYSYKYAMPGDEHKPTFHPVIFDVETGNRTDVALDQVRTFLNIFPPQSLGHAWWSSDSHNLFLVSYSPFNKSVDLYRVDPASGDASLVLQESSDTIVRLAHENDGVLMVRTLESGDIIWFSERDGYGHLYLYDGKTGALKNQITHGNWVVRDIVSVDESAGYVYFLASGVAENVNPYWRQLFRIGLDGAGLELLTPEAGDHEVRVTPVEYTRASIQATGGSVPGKSEEAFSASGRYFIDVVSSVTEPARTLIRKSSGELVSVVVEEDISALKRSGHTPIEPFVVTAADGKTPIYGNIYRPSNFNADARYPIIDFIYGGPQAVITARRFDEALFGMGNRAQTLAELGFIVITVDGRGTPLRSKAFLDESYGRLGDAGNLDDHIAALQQLAKRFAYIDIDRVGIFGFSAGGYASIHAILKYPDFFKVAVAQASNNDQRGNTYVWAETYNGPEKDGNYLAASNIPLAGNLKGKLLLMHGDMDDNVHPALTMQLVEALMKTNRDFDLVILPNQSHRSNDAYSVRKRWDYFVRHLGGETPPPNYAIKSLQ